MLLFLAISLAPFAIVAPFIGPIIDRLPGGRRFTVFLVSALRCITVLLITSRLNSLSLFALAFISLVLARTYSVSKTALVPTLTKNTVELVAANGKLGLLSGLVSFAAAVPAGLLQLIDARFTLCMSALMFGLAAVAALQLPRHVATTPTNVEKATIEKSPLETIKRVALSMMLLRGVIGFLFFHVAFWLRDESAGTAWFGLAIGLSSFAIMIANFAASFLRRIMSERRMIMLAFVVAGATGVITGIIGGITAGIVLISVTNGMGAVGRLAFESVVQSEVSDANRARIFVKFETRNQLAWVGFGLVAVIVSLPGAVGFVAVGVACFSGAAFFSLDKYTSFRG